MLGKQTFETQMIDDAVFLALVVSENGKMFRHVTPSDLRILDLDSCIVGIVHPEVANLVPLAAGHHVRANRLVNAVTLLVKEVAVPTDDRSAEVVTSFLVSGAVASIIRGFPADLGRWCYLILKYILDQERVPCEIQIVHKAVCDVYPLVADATCDVILPHCGSETHLRLSTDSLRQQTLRCDIVIAIDQDHIGKAFLADISGRDDIQAYQLEPCRVGPDVARHVFSMRSRADYVAFQDSDDISLPRRLATLAAAAENTEVGIVGSHELQVHEVQERVYAVRYPLNVNASLKRAGANHQLLLPTSLVKQHIFTEVGGFSTCPLYHDVAFWLTASFFTKIINVDEFLYIRRRHPSSLTMHPTTGTDSSLRQEIVARRRADYASILEGTLRLEGSTLAIRHRDGCVKFSELKTGEVIEAKFES